MKWKLQHCRVPNIDDEWWIHFRFQLVYFHSKIRVKNIEHQNPFIIYYQSFVFVATFKFTLSITCLWVLSTFDSKKIPRNVWDDEEKCKFSFHSKSNRSSRISTLIDSWREIRYIGCESVCVGCRSLSKWVSNIYFFSFFILHTVLVIFLFKFYISQSNACKIRTPNHRQRIRT